MKQFEDWTFDELVDYHTGKIHIDLFAGNYKIGVWSALSSAILWQQAQDSKHAQSEKRRAKKRKDGK